jgi:XRE family transcriptional regulator, regulator of sulfur utilization
MPKTATRPHHHPPSVGETIRQLRRDRNWTIDELSRSSGVSKSMLSQIERGLTNPTVATLWRLTNALGVPIEAALRGPAGEPAAAIEHQAAHATPSIGNADGSVRLRVLGPLSLAGKVEWYELLAQPGGLLASEPHPDGTEEHLSVLDGRLQVDAGNASQEALTGETVRYAADQRHAIRNPGSVPARALLLVFKR